MCKAHYKEFQVSQSNNDTEEGAEDLAAFSDAVRVAAHGSRRGRETSTSTVGIEATPTNVNNNVCDEKTICNNVPGVSHQHNINSAPGAVERESAQRAVAREEPGVREHELAQRAVAREEPGVQEHELAQRVVAREEPGV